MQFVLVNGRSPLPQSFCTLCCERIQGGLRSRSRDAAPYRGHKLYFDHGLNVALVLKSREGIMSRPCRSLKTPVE
jgi:hypothetical protein